MNLRSTIASGTIARSIREANFGKFIHLHVGVELHRVGPIFIMTIFLHFENPKWRSDRVHCVCTIVCLEVKCCIEAEKEALTRQILQVQQLFTPPGSCLVDNATLSCLVDNATLSCLVDNATLLSATCDAAEREATQFPTPAAPTNEPRRVAIL